MIYSNKGDIDSVRSMNFTKKNKDVELIIIDSLWNEKTKEKLVDLTSYFKKVTYAPPKERKQERKYNFLAAHNTGLAYSEEDWCMASGGRNEFRQNFFEKLKETIDNFGCGVSMKNIDEAEWMDGGGGNKRLLPKYVDFLNRMESSHSYGVAIRPVELEANMCDTKWNYDSRFKQRYVFLPTVPMGRKDERGFIPIVTCGFIIMPRKTWYAINGFNEQYDVGCYWWDNELFDSIIANRIHIILDQQLMIYRHPHTSACLPENPECRTIYETNLLNKPKKAPNDFDFAELHERCMEKKKDFIL